MPCDPVETSCRQPGAAPGLPEGMPPLCTFYIYLSDNCNLRCRHCWIVPRFVDGRPDPARNLDPDLLLAAVREARPLGLNAAKLTGGEPMIHPRFLEVVDMLTDEGLSLTMETNGTLMTAEAARHIRKDTALTFISVSLDGADARTHDAFRGVAGAFDAALRGISHLVDAGFNGLQVIMSVHRGNRNQVEAVVKLAAERGVKSVKLNPVTPAGRGSTMERNDECLDFDEQLQLARYVDNELGPRVPVGIYLGLPPALQSLKRLRRTGGSCGDCGVRGILGILGTGHYALCGIGTTCPEFVYGKLGQDSIRDIWLTNPTILYLRRALGDPDGFPEVCAKCIFARDCRTGCVADNYIRTGNLLAPDSLCAEAARRGVFPPARAQRRRGGPINT
ncbi:radical SAM protein [candidate division WOR-3 bacterium]|nr:radical SAM protein [candidate division WOR-3 bacterium]